MIQPEPAYNPGDLRTIQQPNYWSQLGSSEIGHQCNKKWAKILSMNFFQKFLIGHVLLSQMEYPGPCEAGAVIFFLDDPSGLELTRPVAARGSILLAELIAILMVLELAVSKKISDFSSSEALLLIAIYQNCTNGSTPPNIDGRQSSR